MIKYYYHVSLCYLPPCLRLRLRLRLSHFSLTLTSDEPVEEAVETCKEIIQYLYYEAPSGKKLRSMVEIQKYLIEHPEYTRDGITLSQFSFQIPKPLQENYVRRRPAKVTVAQDTIKSLDPNEAAVNPLGWAGPDSDTNLQLGRPALPPLPFETPVLDPVPRPAKKVKTTPSKQLYSNNLMCNQQQVTVEEPGQSRNSSSDL